MRIWHLLLGMFALPILYMLSQGVKLLPFNYLDFSNAPGVTIVDYGEQDKLYFADPMPSAIQVDRPTYSFLIRSGFYSSMPRVYVTALNGTAKLEGDSATTGECTGFSWQLRKEIKDKLTFS